MGSFDAHILYVLEKRTIMEIKEITFKLKLRYIKENHQLIIDEAISLKYNIWYKLNW